MEEEIDLRPYVVAVVRRWYWIVAAFFVPIITVATIFSTRPPQYEATAIVAYVAPADVVQFDPRFSEGEVGRPLRAIPELATSDAVWQQLVAEMGWQQRDDLTPLRSALTAEMGSENTLVHFTVTHHDPAQAAQVANAWAAVFVDWANSIYSQQGGQRLRFFEQQLADAEEALTRATDAWIAFNGANESLIISDTLAFYLQTRRSYLQRQQELAGLSDSVQAFHRQMGALPAAESVSFADQLTYYQLQSRVMNDGESTPIILQTETGTELITASRDQYLLLAEGFQETVARRQAQIAQALQDVEPRILALQREQQALAAEAFRLRNAVNVARDTVVSLSYKVEEERITARDESSGFRLASRAATPERPIIRRGIRLSVLSGFFSCSLLLFFLFAQIWWRQVTLSLAVNEQAD